MANPRILFITQTIDENNPVMSFTLEWIAELNKHVPVTVLTQQVWDHTLSVPVYSLGKERRCSKLRQIINFYKIVLSLQYTHVVVHMISEYVLIGAPVWMRKRVALWRAKGTVPLKFRVAALLVHTLFSSSQASCRIKSKNVRLIGHGINTDAFKPSTKGTYLYSIGRICPTKDHATVIRALAHIKNAKLRVLGNTVIPADTDYLHHLKNLVDDLDLNDRVQFLTNVPHTQMLEQYNECSILVNASYTGSLDKVGLEAMACAIPVVSCNEAFAELLPGTCMFTKGSAEDCRRVIEHVLSMSVPERKTLGKHLRTLIVEKHNLNNLIARIHDWVRAT